MLSYQKFFFPVLLLPQGKCKTGKYHMTFARLALTEKQLPAKEANENLLDDAFLKFFIGGEICSVMQQPESYRGNIFGVVQSTVRLPLER